MAIIVSKDGEVARKLSPEVIEEEKELQKYVAMIPDALPLDTLRDDLKLLVIGREFQTAAGPIDVFAVDDQGQLYVVETKLFKNPDKRHVIAQMLDYGASLWRGYMNTDQFMSDVETACKGTCGKGLDAALQSAFKIEDEGSDGIRRAMQRNLASGNVQFVVLMDRLSERLRDLILFVNRNSRFSIFAVELEFYLHDGLKIAIPRLHGAEVQKDAQVAPARDEIYNWNPQRFADTVRKNFTGEKPVGDSVIEMFNFLNQVAGDPEFKNMTFKAKDCYAHFSFAADGAKRALTLATDGTLRLNFRWMEKSRKGAELAGRFRDAVTKAAVLDLKLGQNDQGNEYEVTAWAPKALELREVVRDVLSGS